MSKWRKKPVKIDAIKYLGDENFNLVRLFVGESRPIHMMGDSRLGIETLEGVMTAQVGDYIIRGIRGEIYPCKPDIFEETYEMSKQKSMGQYATDLWLRLLATKSELGTGSLIKIIAKHVIAEHERRKRAKAKRRGEEMKTYYRDFRGDMTEATQTGRYGEYCKYNDVRIVLEQNKQLTDRLAQVEKERDELKRGKSCADCSVSAYYEDEPCCVCKWRNKGDYFKPRDPSAEKGCAE